ncbi:MAG TPA: homoserine O-succinyltransferase [Solirubrobacteraceae bacterium]|nr:homoserine O-succinyltransferase [Solirubrobacteraceae bacterium]
MVVELFTPPRRAGRPLTVALVNNMPDGAFTDTEDQFRRLVSGAGPNLDLELYTITAIERSDRVALAIDARYRDLDELWTRPPDALIVTGTEPTQPDMRDEPTWPYIARLLAWAADSVPTVLLSCLASHASLLFFDGLQRERLPHKCSGVYAGPVANPADPLAAGLPEQVVTPHSRLNEVPVTALVDAGYRIVVGGEESPVGWSVATRDIGNAQFVLCQGHPEYGTLSLLREYRRDVRRYLQSRGALPYPLIPDGYLSRRAQRTLAEFAAVATSANHDPQQLAAAFPYRQIADSVQNTWRAPSMTLYANWLELARAAVATVA